MMETYIKYPVKKESLNSCKIQMFVLCESIKKLDNNLIVYPKHDVDLKGNIVYPKENNIGFYCKSLKKSDIVKFKGGINIEKCELKDRVFLARKWYKEYNKNLPRKQKKVLISTKSRF